MKYTLIQTYPGYETLGTIHCSENKTPEWLGTNFYDAHPKYWQKVEEVDYEILSFQNIVWKHLVELHSNNLYCCKISDTYNGKGVISKEDCLNNEELSIYSVKRLSNGEVFTIGDKIKYGGIAVKISSFETERNIIWVKNKNGGACILSSVTKSKTPLFTTEDGVEIFEGDKFYYPNIHIWKTIISEADKRVLIFIRLNKYKPFSTKEKSEEYILLNKPCLSVNEIIAVIPGFNFHKEILIAKAKSKL